jgi:hypothetical protein
MARDEQGQELPINLKRRSVAMHQRSIMTRLKDTNGGTSAIALNDDIVVTAPRPDPVVVSIRLNLASSPYNFRPNVGIRTASLRAGTFPTTLSRVAPISVRWRSRPTRRGPMYSVKKTFVCAALIAALMSSQASAFSVGSGNGNGNGNVGVGNGNGNGNGNTGFFNGNGNGNFNVGALNGNGNGNGNHGALSGNGNGNFNFGIGNGNLNGNFNWGTLNGNGNGNFNR